MQIQPSNILLPNLAHITSLDQFWDRTKYNFNSLPTNEVFTKSENPAFYIYKIQSGNIAYQGITGIVPIQAYLDGEIKGHENTLEYKEQRQIELLQERNVQVKPVLLTYPAVPSIEHWIQAQQEKELLLKVRMGKQEHLLWKVDSPREIAVIQYLFRQHVRQTYIADGHHRTAATTEYAQTVSHPVYLYCALFSSLQIDILPFNRIVDGVRERSLQGLMEHLRQWCEVSEIKPYDEGVSINIKMYVQQKWYNLKWKASILAQRQEEGRLDAALLDLEVLKHLMQVDDIRNNEKVQYISGDDLNFEKLRRKVDQHPDRVGFCLPSMSFQDFMAIVDRGYKLPPKSTWFKPRMLNGLLVYELK